MADKTEIDKLDDHIKEIVDGMIATKMADPDLMKKVALQTKYAEAMGDALTDANAKGKTIDNQNEFGKLVLLTAKSNNDPEKAHELAQKMYPDDLFILGCTKALTAGTPSEGGFAVPEILSSDVIKVLNPNLAYSKLGARRIDMPNGNITIARFDQRASCTYIGETAKAGDTKPVLGALKGSSKKAAAFIPISNDLLRSANPSFSGFVQDDVINSLKLFRDYTAFYGSGNANTPAGIKSQLTSTEKIGDSNTVFTADTPANMKGLLMAKNVPMVSPGWVFNGYHWSWLYNLKTSTGAYIYRDEMNKGTLLGEPFVVSNQIYSDNLAGGTAPTSSNYGEMFFGDWSEFIEFVQLDMELMVSKEASYVDANGTAMSAMQNDMTVLRVLSLHDFGLRHKESFVMSTNKYSLT